MTKPNHVRVSQNMKIFEDDAELRIYIRSGLEHFAHKARQEPGVLDLARELASFLNFPATCPRASCRRKGVCTSPYVVCQFERCLEFEGYQLAPEEIVPTPPPASSSPPQDRAN